MAVTVGVIGGSGLYHIEGLEDPQDVVVETPFGNPSDVFHTGTLHGVKLVFLARHGKGHKVLPHELNYRANIWGFKNLGCKWIIAVTAVGSLREEIVPGHIVLPDQLIDRTNGRQSTFFGEGVAAHVGFGTPYSDQLRAALAASCEALGITYHNGGTLVTMNGPAFSTKAESHMYRSWGANIIGMTALPEAKLVREAEMGYASLALATDYDCWHESEEDVTAEAVGKIVASNVARAKQIISHTIPAIVGFADEPCHTVLDHAIMTDKAVIPQQTLTNLRPILQRVLQL